MDRTSAGKLLTFSILKSITHTITLLFTKKCEIHLIHIILCTACKFIILQPLSINLRLHFFINAGVGFQMLMAQS